MLKAEEEYRIEFIVDIKMILYIDCQVLYVANGCSSPHVICRFPSTFTRGLNTYKNICLVLHAFSFYDNIV